MNRNARKYTFGYVCRAKTDWPAHLHSLFKFHRPPGCSHSLSSVRWPLDMSQRYSKTKVTIRRATSEDSDQPAHPRSLIRIFADRMCLLQPPGFIKRDKWEYLPYWVDVQADLSLCWLHRSYCRSYCRFCRALAHMYFRSLVSKLSKEHPDFQGPVVQN